MANPEWVEPNKYGRWNISFDYGYYVAYHDNYDASYEGEEDGWVDNGMKVSARTYDELIEEIKEFESESS